jgi:general secretion pathway protein I
MNRRGFTLLEMLVATTIMGIAVVGLLGSLQTSLNNAARLTGYDRAAVLARAKMDELLIDPHLPEGVPLQGAFDPSLTGDTAAGWSAMVTPFDVPPGAVRNTMILERIDLRVWWGNGQSRHILSLDGYRKGPLPEALAPRGQ